MRDDANESRVSYAGPSEPDDSKLLDILEWLPLAVLIVVLGIIIL